MFPVFAKAREKARQAACASNEKQIGLGILQYIQDNDEYMPQRQNNYSVSCKNNISPYIKSTGVFQCPSNPRKGDNDFDANGFTISYSVNTGSDRPFVDATNQVSLASLQAPAQTIGVVESTTRYTDFYVGNPGLWGQATASGTAYQGNLFAGHTGFANFQFLDSHVKAMRPLATLDTASGGSGAVNLWTNDNVPLATTPGDASGFTVCNYSQNTAWKQ